MTVRCSICKAGLSVVRFVDASPELSAAALHRQAATVGMNLSPERIGTHRRHRQEELPAKVAKTKRDFAILVRDKASDQFEAGHLDLTDKDTVPGITAGLKAQGIIDAREKQKAKQGNAELAFAIIAMLSGVSQPPLALDDGLTIEGTATEVEDDGDDPI